MIKTHFHLDYCDGACKNGATCIGLENGYKCECTQFYQGITCDEGLEKF